MPGEGVGYQGWLRREDYRLLRQLEREVYPSIQEMLAERHLLRQPSQRDLAVVDSLTTPIHDKEGTE